MGVHFSLWLADLDFWVILGSGAAAAYSRPVFSLWGISILISTVDLLIFPSVGKGCFLSTSSPSLVIWIFFVLFLMTAKASYSKKPARDKVISENPGLSFKRRMPSAALCSFPPCTLSSNPCTFSKLFTKLMLLVKNFGKQFLLVSMHAYTFFSQKQYTVHTFMTASPCKKFLAQYFLFVFYVYLYLYINKDDIYCI